MFLVVNNDAVYYTTKFVQLATIVEGDPKAPFSIATTPRCREDATPSPGLTHFTLDDSRRHQVPFFESLV